MNIKEAKIEIIHTLQAYNRRDEYGAYVYPVNRQRPILLMGPPGIGKTAVMEQIAAECGVGLVSYTITHHTRQSAVGLPKIVTRTYGGREVSVTEYTMSEIIASVYECMERTGKKEGILFIDEINCVSETLTPSMLQFLQNKTFGTHRVPAGWLIVAAGNPARYNRSAREFDIVTLDRVRRIDILEDLDVWLEYAWANRVHGAVLSYLNIKRERFYEVETTLDGQFFVTARGWEDLSEILKSYEAADLEVSEELVKEYLQKDDTAGDFCAYYQLYRKYGTDYGITEILKGALPPGLYQKKTEMVKKASFEERFTVVGLVLDALNSALSEWNRTDGETKRLYQSLLRFRDYSRARENGSCMEEFLQNQKKSLEVRVQAELATLAEARETGRLLHTLAEYGLTLKKEHITDKEQAFERLKELFGEQAALQKSCLRDMKKYLDAAFSFLEECFGDGQEMVLFVTGLTKNRRAAEFIAGHGCDAYFRYSRQLLTEDREEELRIECAEMVRTGSENT